ncbi:MAG: division/cell wall cluster transcriptional repressor MraZ [Clostridia bacterium]|nr:division/cell wall cluster transcriptional repressor MraZ [Clostridia bacterium]
MLATLVGHYSHTVDDKNRVFIPAKHRDQLGESFMITQLFDKCISVYSMNEWDKLTDKINELPQIEARDILLFLFSNAVDVQPDKQGRIILSQELREYAEIEKNAVVVGAGNHVEIWSDKNWADKKSQMNAADILGKLKNLGF